MSKSKKEIQELIESGYGRLIENNPQLYGMYAGNGSLNIVQMAGVVPNLKPRAGCGFGAYGHRWSANNLCEDCGLSVVSMIAFLRDGNPDDENKSAEIGYLLNLGTPRSEEAAKCRCDIRDLMSTGHDNGCPEKKR